MSSTMTDRPVYDEYRPMSDTRAGLAAGFARQILDTTGPYLPRPVEHLRVLDVGCGYGHTSIELARQCHDVVGIEPSEALFQAAEENGRTAGLPNLEFRHQGVYELRTQDYYDLIVLDNVLEHLPDQPVALAILSKALAPGGVMYLLLPNKLWPMEVHYNLPFLSYLPLPLANLFLRLSGRGKDYTDASYAPTYWRLKRMLRDRSELDFGFMLPADISLATQGNSWLYRNGIRAIKRFPFLWCISKAFLVVAKKQA